MALAARVQNVGLTFAQAAEDAIDEVKSTEWMINTARTQHAEVMKTPPKPLRWRLFIDGVETNQLSAVRWDSTIRFQYSRIDVVVEYAMEALVRLSPVLTGRYQSTHTILVDGVPATNLKDWEWGQDIIITNVQPYSRKIEVGAMKMRVPGTDHVYRTATKFVRSKYGTVAEISFTFRGLVEGAFIDPAKTNSKEHNKADLRYPVMIIKAERG